MTQATTSIRWPLAKHLVTTVAGQVAADGVAVEPGWPGDKNVKKQMIWVDEIADSVSEVVVMAGGRTIRDDFFTIVLLTRVAGLRTLDATMTRLSELGALIENPVADSPTLDDFDSLVSADFVTTNLTCGVSPAGPLGYGRHEVRVHSRLF